MKDKLLLDLIDVLTKKNTNAMPKAKSLIIGTLVSRLYMSPCTYSLDVRSFLPLFRFGENSPLSRKSGYLMFASRPTA